MGSELSDRLEPGAVFGEGTGVGEVLPNNHVRQSEQEMCVGAGSYEVMLVGDFGCPASPRVDHDHAATALLDRSQASPDIGRGHEAAVRGERVCTEGEQVVGPVDIRHRNARDRAEHEAGGHVFRHLVDGRGGEDVSSPDRLREHPAIDQGVDVVGVRIAEVERDRVAASLLEDG